MKTPEQIRELVERQKEADYNSYRDYIERQIAKSFFEGHIEFKPTVYRNRLVQDLTTSGYRIQKIIVDSEIPELRREVEVISWDV
jgi:enoyl reductase-like protein